MKSTFWESAKVEGGELLGRVKEIVREGNVRRVVIQHGGANVAEFPLTVGVVGALAAPAAAAIGALAAVLTECTIRVERSEDAPPARPATGGRPRQKTRTAKRSRA
jgi:hypothetical protein